MSSSFIDDRLPLACGLMASGGAIIEGNGAFFAFIGRQEVEAPPHAVAALAAAVAHAEAEGYCEESLTTEKGTAVRLGFCRLEGLPGRVLALPALAQECPAAERRALAETLAGVVAKAQLADRAQAEAREQFAALAEQSPHGISISENNMVRYANQRLAQMFRLGSPTDIVDRISADDLVVPEERVLMSEQRRIAIQTGSARYAFTALRQDGSRFEASAVDRAIRFGDRPALLSVLTDISDKLQREKEAERRSFNDSLTGLPNQTLLFDRLGQLIARARRGDELFGLLIIGIERLQDIVGKLGQEAGDQVVRIVAERLTANLRSSDTLARLEGNQFAVIAESLLFGDDVELVAQKLANAVGSKISLAGEEFSLGVSIGSALFPASAEETESLFRAASTAMQSAQENRSGHVLFGGGVSEE